MSQNRPVAEAQRDGRPRAGLALLAGALAFGLVLLLEGAGSPAAAALPPAPWPHFDKLLHGLAHAVLAGTCFVGLMLLGKPRLVRHRRRVAAACALAFSTLLGIGAELMQAGPGAEHGRVFDFADIAANLIGATTALTVGLLLTHKAAKEIRACTERQA